jgi:branched-chain amino acid transport system substrate-binding protein
LAIGGVALGNSDGVDPQTKGVRVNRFVKFFTGLAAGLMLVGTVVVGGVGGTGVASAAGSLAPIKIGVVCSCTGPLASSIIVGPPAYQAWADYTNAHGGIQGHKVDVILVDDAYNPNTSLTEVKTLVTVDHVVALVDSSDVDAAWSKYIDTTGVPVVGGGSSGQLEDTDANWFAVGQTLDDYFINFIDAAKKVGASNMGELYCAEAATCQEGVAPFEATAKKVGEKVGYVTQVSFSAPNYDAQCLAAKQAGVEALTVADAVSVVESVASDCTKQGYTPWQIALDGAVGESFLTAPGLENHFIGSEPDIPFFSNITPASKLMNATLKKYANATTLTSANYNEQATQMYVSGLMLTAAVKDSGAGSSKTITSAAIRKGLYSFHNETLGGMAPPLNFKKSVPNPVDCWYWIRIQSGKFTTPYGVTPVCVKPPKIS